MRKRMSPEQLEKLRRYQKAHDKVPQGDDAGRVWSALEDKYEQDLRKELDKEAEFEKLVKQRTKRELNSLRKIGETEAFGIIMVDHVFSVEYYPTLPIKDESGNYWEFRQAPLRIISLWVKQFASDIEQAKTDLDGQVDDTVKAIGHMTKVHKALQAFEKLFKEWCNQESAKGRADRELNAASFIMETGRLNPGKTRDGTQEPDEGRFEDYDEDTGEIRPN